MYMSSRSGAKATDVVGLYMAPPENAAVICVDEKPSIQALERAQGYLKLPNGRALTGHSYDYVRNGTSTLPARAEDRPRRAQVVVREQRSGDAVRRLQRGDGQSDRSA
jgi:hypothetical protein